MRKDLIIAVLLTFCFTATLFMVATTRSQEYDPWADLNGDGKIDILDVVGVTGIYATTGDPAKNVTIVNWPKNNLAYSVDTTVGGFAGFESPYINTAGYSKISICIYTSAAQNTYTLHARHRTLTLDFNVDYAENMMFYVKTYDVPNEQVLVSFFNADASSRYLNLDIYLIA